MPKKDGIDYNLRFMAEVLGVDHLHWGYFPAKRFSGEAFPLAELRAAQEEYTERLFAHIPTGMLKILDAGCGIGKTAEKLRQRGYEVHCLTNDAYQQAVIKERYPDLPFTRAKFEECPLTERFDLILMSESSQYMDWPKALARIRELLGPGGHLLLSDYFRKKDDPYYRTCRVKDDFERLTAAAGFELLREEDITDHVLPTLDFGNYYCQKYILPALNIAIEMAESRMGRLTRGLSRLLLRKKLAKLWYYAFEKTPQKLDRNLFAGKMRYVIQLWRAG